MKFDIGETVICSVEVRNDADVLVDPATSMKITILNPYQTVVVNNVDMTKDAVGKYHYDYTLPSTASCGKYNAKYIATDGSRITISKDTFEVE